MRISLLTIQTCALNWLTGLHDLRYKAKILHRDISINNIMYEIRDGVYYFVLIDFDMAAVVEGRRGKSTYQASSKHRTGTLPFMAWELIEDAVDGMNNPKWIPIPHLLRHDYESLFYVSFWSVTAIPCPRDPKQKKILQEFAKKLDADSLSQLSAAKERFISSKLKPALAEASPAADYLRKWFAGFAKVFRIGFFALKEYETDLEVANDAKEIASIKASFDFVTLNGHLTKESLKAGVAPYIPGQSDGSIQVARANNAAAAESAPGLAEVEAPDSVERLEAVERKEQSNTAGLEVATGRAQDDLRNRRRNTRKNRMTVDQAMAAEEYRNTRLRARKPRVYY